MRDGLSVGPTQSRQCRAESSAMLAKAASGAARAAAQGQCPLAAALLYRASGSFYEALPSPTPEDMKSQTV